MADYVPSSDADFDAWARNFVDNVVANAAALGVTTPQVEALQAAQADWGAKYPASNAAQAAVNSAVQAQNDSRSGYEGLIRSQANIMQSSPRVTDPQRQALGLN